jgi:hypothetical protein
MTDTLSTYNTPVLWINTYLQEKLKPIVDPANTGNPLLIFPFFPTGPSSLEALQTSFPETGVMAVWDRMFRMRRGPFPHIKCEQVLYYFYAQASNPVPTMIQIQEIVMRYLDRGDETAQELNAWAKAKSDAGGIGGMVCKFYFHNFKIYHLEEARDIVDFGTARTYAGNKIIIDYDYHQMQDVIDSVNS